MAPSLGIGTSFDSLDEAKQAITRWVVDRGESFKVFKSDPKRCWVIVCRDKAANCPFRIRANRDKRGKASLTVLERHTCPANSHGGFRKTNSVAILASDPEIIAALTNDPKLRPKEIQREARLRLGNNVSYQQSWRTKKHIKSSLLAREAEAFRLELAAANMAEPDLHEIHDFLIDLAYKAGEMILAANPSTITADSKKNSSDLVTETDQAVEEMISSSLKSQYPDYSFLGEETYKPGMHLTNLPTFICDPIDGTVNFVHGYPYVCVSLGFTINRVPVVGVVYSPFTATLYTAIKGHGAFMNRSTRLPLKPTPEPLHTLSRALVAVEWGSDRDGVNWDVKTRTFARLGAPREAGGAMVHSLRSLGSAALNMCAVACGTLDVYWEGGCWAWDVAAGWVILTEAGGAVVDGNPGGWQPEVDGRTYLAVRAAPNGQREIVEEFWGHVVGRLEYES